MLSAKKISSDNGSGCSGSGEMEAILNFRRSVNTQKEKLLEIMEIDACEQKSLNKKAF